MRELTAIRLRTLGWLVLPIIVVIFIPWMLRHLTHETPIWHGGLWQWLGLWFLLNGFGLAGWCVNLLNVEGKGTPLPVDPPSQFVVSGPYRYVRNPMMIGALLILLGQAMVFESRAVGCYALGVLIVAHLFVRYWEEPDLARRFGPAYRTYQTHVPRWLPRLP